MSIGAKSPKNTEARNEETSDIRAVFLYSSDACPLVTRDDGHVFLHDRIDAMKHNDDAFPFLCDSSTCASATMNFVELRIHPPDWETFVS